MATLGRLIHEYEIKNGLQVGEAACLVLGRNGSEAENKSRLRVYSRWRNEGVVPQPPQLKKLSEGLGIPARELLDAVETTLKDRATKRADEVRQQLHPDPSETEEPQPRR